MLRIVLMALLASIALPVSATLEDAAEGIHRTPSYVERDASRHPVAVLDFFGVESDDTVVEIWPSAGYWAEILGPFLATSGQYIAAAFDVGPADTPGYRRRSHASLLEKLSNSDLYGKAIVSTADQPDHWTIAAPGSADVVLSFRNVHNWWWGDYADEMFAASFKALKPGGVLGIVDHRAPEGTDLTMLKSRRTGYITEAEVVRLALNAGFQLIARSEINANPKDTTQHPRGVWTLPPSYALGDQDKAKYEAIGESDRMTLKFVKPAR